MIHVIYHLCEMNQTCLGQTILNCFENSDLSMAECVKLRKNCDAKIQFYFHALKYICCCSLNPTWILKAQDPVVYHLQSSKMIRAKSAEIITDFSTHTSFAHFLWAEQHFSAGIRRILWGALVCLEEEEENSFFEQEDASFWTNVCKRFHNSMAGYVWNVTSS